MRQDVKDLADAMERGWSEIPRMSTGRFFSFDEWDKNIVACCALGHLRIGLNRASAAFLWERMPVLDTQAVILQHGEKLDLFNAIIKLNDEYHWSTPEIVAWLRTHL
jgi:hypothetical protein